MQDNILVEEMAENKSTTITESGSMQIQDELSIAKPKDISMNGKGFEASDLGQFEDLSSLIYHS